MKSFVASQETPLEAERRVDRSTGEVKIKGEKLENLSRTSKTQSSHQISSEIHMVVEVIMARIH